jgi:hypothetical protein
MRTIAALVLGAVLLAPAVFGAAVYKSVPVPANNCIQTNLINTFPEGSFTAANEFATTFVIPTTPATCGFTGTGACNLYDAYAPPAGVQIATITFVGSRGATETYPLVAGKNTGSPGVYLVHEQEFTLPIAFLRRRLVKIIVTDTNNGSAPIIL